MRTLLAFIISGLTALWIYGSVRVYTCSVENTCDFVTGDPSYQVVVMLIGTFLFGYIFGNILSGLRTKKYIKRSELDTVQGSYTQAKKLGIYEQKDEVDNKYIHGITHSEALENEEFHVDKSLKDQDSDIDNIAPKKEVDREDSLKNKSLFSSFLDELNFDDETKKPSVVDNKKIKTTTSEDTIDFEIKNHTAVKREHTDTNNTLHTHSFRGEKTATKKVITKDKLTKIEGIGPKIEQLLNSKNIYTFEQLAQTDAFYISEILSEAGTRFQMHNPTTWPKQAMLARKGRWTELKEYQDLLDGGKE